MDRCLQDCTGVVRFPDVNLNEAIREEIEISHQPVTVEVLEDIQVLSRFGSLTALYFSSNRVDDMSPLATVSGLTRLGCGDNAAEDLTPISTLDRLDYLELESGGLDGLEFLQGLVSLSSLRLRQNQVRDLRPLVRNPGIGADDVIGLQSNPIDCDGQADDIRELRDRGVRLQLDCP
jgi:hypothetical protein